jgi:hypothetical protein
MRDPLPNRGDNLRFKVEDPRGGIDQNEHRALTAEFHQLVRGKSKTQAIKLLDKGFALDLRQQGAKPTF